MSISVLFVEDEQNLGSTLEKGFNELGFNAKHANNAEMALEMAMKGEFDIIVSDIIMPKTNGVSLMHELRQKGITCPFLFLSALGSVDDKVFGFEQGADDYLSKPFEFRELVVRVKSLVRRGQTQVESEFIECNTLTADLKLKKIVRDNIEIQLTQKEYDLLIYFLQNQNKVISRLELMHKVWGLNFDTGTNLIDVYVNYLRNKINVRGGKKMIETIHGQGYRLNSTYAD